MQYDPIKRCLARLLGRSTSLRRLFFIALDLLFLRAWYVRRELRLLKSRITNHESTILDAGMGFGQYSDRMLRTFKDATLVGLEIDRRHIYGSEDYFRKVHDKAYIVIGDVQDQPLAGQRFDLALTVDVMEHVEDDKATFAEFHRVLKPGGYLVMHTPRILEAKDAPPLPPPAERGGNAKESRWRVDEHVRDGYSDIEARERIEHSGMKVVKIVRGYGWAGHIAWTLLQRIPLSWMSRGRLMMLPVIPYLVLAFPAALCFMWLDMLRGDNPKGGSLLVIAQRPVEG